jgi:hypothetical protein
MNDKLPNFGIMNNCKQAEFNIYMALRISALGGQLQRLGTAMI